VASRAGHYYDPFDILPHGAKTWRHIDNPSKELKTLQSRIYRAILADYEFPSNVVGGIPGRSILDNVIPHLGAKCVITVDISKCFPSIHDKMVFNALRKAVGFSEDVAALLTKLTTFQHRLPQGAPSSPIIANLVMRPLHHELDKIARAFDLRWTMYVDDITLSGARAAPAVESVVKAVQRAGFAISHHKLHVMSNSCRQSVTGLVVNRSKVSAGRARLEEIRQTTLDLLERDVITEFEFRSVIGKIRYVGWVKGTQGEALSRLADALLPVARKTGSRRPKTPWRPCKNYSRGHAAVTGEQSQDRVSRSEPLYTS
jgi:retron-type reverse transcriptase